MVLAFYFIWRYFPWVQQYLRFLAVNLPLAITRNWLYMLTVATTFTILLPLSGITYYRFYQTLIPPPSPQIPLIFNTNDEWSHSEPTILGEELRNYEFDPLLRYRLNINLMVVCPEYNTYYKTRYSVVDDSSDKKIHSSTFFIDCEKSYLYNTNNDYIPYNLRFWVSPVLVNLNRMIRFSLNKYVLSGSEIQEKLAQFKILVENHLIVLDDVSYVQIETDYTGFRFYLVKYFYTCFCVGTVILWCISGAISMLTSLYVVYKYSDDETELPSESETESDEEFRETTNSNSDSRNGTRHSNSVTG
ncbi:predicted protein [Scheffersomyces stipitis CBS 6054]|uniref:Seipin n=1 Tax=Scheffersomyces stipitis (strain ATCC 58785 / CBS 6054 / NBRC 10063 / NRRL Y-11545) TaxID=322104 RepID=A3GHF8_PICST|nr:predicted protein [Scheffersomyces stipitis CBS 6054]EAZ63049.1 predicted protein [Scheffersomyces stipitis CBS 6054]